MGEFAPRGLHALHQEEMGQISSDFINANCVKLSDLFWTDFLQVLLTALYICVSVDLLIAR
jgi:hypothetical protein